jgi:hypothetical protein
MCVTSNLTIDDGLELEVDKKMTALGAAALPQHRLRSSVTLDWFSSTASLIACRISASSTKTSHWLLELCLVRSQDSLPTPTSFPLAVSPRRSPARHAFASPLDVFLETFSFKCSFELRHQLHSVLLSCFFYRRSFATVNSLLQLRNSMETLCRRSNPTAATRHRSKVCRQFFFFFINVCDVKLDDRRRA